MINLLPYNQKKLIERIRLIRVAAVTIGAMILLTIAGGLLFMPTLMTINSRFALAQSEIAVLEAEGVVTGERDIAALQARTATALRQFAAPLGVPPTTYIDTIRSQADGGISLSGFTRVEGLDPTMLVIGVAANREALKRFIASLQAQPNVTSVDSPITNYVKNKDSDFTITIIFKK
jgi:Tfp pilus assembly protein PilN